MIAEMVDDRNILPWQRHNWSLLSAYITQQRIPQALLITAGKGQGKRHLAEQFAQALLCANKRDDGYYCGQCHSCTLFHARTHPDFLTIIPEQTGKAIVIDQIRQLITKLGLKPQFENYRVVIIDPAEQMNTSAANAFLKYLEEPTERTVILLLAEQPARLPATITSRCQKMPIKPDLQAAQAWLREKIPDQDVEVLLNMTRGAPLLARQYARDNIPELRNACFQNWLGVAEQRIDPVALAKEWQQLPDRLVLFWLTTWVIDLIKCHHQPQMASGLYNPDLSRDLQELAEKLDLKRLFSFYGLLLIDNKRIDTPLNKQLLFEELLIDWQQLNPR